MSLGKKEEQLYEPILDTLREIFRQYVEKEIKAKEEAMREPMDFLMRSVYLEITAKGHFSEMLKEQLDDRALSIIRVEKFSPDIMGYVQKSSSSRKELITVEVKAKPITIKNISRAKLYQDIFKATYGLLISTKRISEEIRRFILDRLSIKGNLIIAQFDEERRILRIHPAFEYHVPELFKKCVKK
ncbi:MAG: hypothetical protein OEY88_07790 [Candidatus Bathyarchaeota archaeon]|nr:hypothetical protein [Candidatus Bathyarchaeota archaeon]